MSSPFLLLPFETIVIAAFLSVAITSFNSLWCLPSSDGEPLRFSRKALGWTVRNRRLTEKLVKLPEDVANGLKTLVCTSKRVTA